MSFGLTMVYQKSNTQLFEYSKDLKNMAHSLPVVRNQDAGSTFYFLCFLRF